MASGSNGKKSRGVYSSLQALIDSNDLTGGTSVWVHGGARYDIYNTDPGDGIQLANGSWAKESQATGGSGEINTGSNIGTGEGVFAQKSGVDLQFKSIKATGGVSVSSDADSVTVDGSSLIPISDKGIANGIATLQGDGKIPSSQLPSYVDDVLEYPTFTSFPVSGESGKIYVALDTNTQYRWSGSTYVAFGSGSTPWGAITGTLANQTDLQQALDAKAGDAPDVGVGETKKYVRQVSESGGVQTKSWVEDVNGGGVISGQQLIYEHSSALPSTVFGSTTIPFTSTYFSTSNNISGLTESNSTFTVPPGVYNVCGQVSLRGTTSPLDSRIRVVSSAGDSVDREIGGGRFTSTSPTVPDGMAYFDSILVLSSTTTLTFHINTGGGSPRWVSDTPSSVNSLFRLEITKL